VHRARLPHKACRLETLVSLDTKGEEKGRKNDDKKAPERQQLF